MVARLVESLSEETHSKVIGFANKCLFQNYLDLKTEMANWDIFN